MNLKKLGLPVLCCGAAFLTSCGYTYKTTQTLTHDEAVEWVEQNYGKETAQFVAPTSSSSEWAFDAYMNDYGKSGVDAYGRLTTHFNNFLSGYSHVDPKVAAGTAVDEDLNWDEFAYKTNDPILNDGNYPFTQENFPMPLRSEIFDKVIDDSGYYGMEKYNCEYIADNKEKTLTVKGTYGMMLPDNSSGYTGFHMLHLADCSITFNNKGYLANIKFEMSKDNEARYTWYNSDKTSWSDSISAIILKGSYMNFTYNY